jgi:hypothetical protein
MEENEGARPKPPGASSGPLRIHEFEGKLFVTGFGLWIPVRSEEEGLLLIQDLEDEGFRICF